MKKLLLIFSVLCCTMAANAQTQPANEIWYTSTDGQVVNPHSTYVFGATITSNTYENGKGIIKFNSTVTSIGANAFWDCSTLNGITIPNSVTSIGHWAFTGCPNLTDIAIPNAVESIGNYAFAHTGLTSITIPSSVTHIRESAFEACPNLTTMIVEQGNPVYDSRDNCNAIIETRTNTETTTYTLISGCKNSVIPFGVTSIGELAFCNCTLASITIPNSVETIGSGSFEDCTALTSIEIPNSVTTIGGSAFAYCSALTSVEISNSVTTIGSSAFKSCTALTSLVIPSSVTTIGEMAFADCTSLESITFMPNTPPSPGLHNWFLNCSNLSVIYVPATAVDIYRNEWSSYADIIEGKDFLGEDRAAAIAEIQNAFDGETGSAYLNGLIANEMAAINNATTIEIITENKVAALAKLSAAVPLYKTIKADAFGEMGEECEDCPAIEVIGQDDEMLKLYNPKKVNFIKN